MPIKTTWNDDQTILLFDFDGVVEHEEILATYGAAAKVIAKMEHPIHVIMDHSHEIVSDENFADVLPQIGSLELPANIELIIQVGTHGSVRARTVLYSQMYRKLHHVDMMEDAYAMFKVYEQRRSTSETNANPD
jgi:hypothetical protein